MADVHDSMDRVESNELPRAGGVTAGATAAGDPTETGGLTTPGTGTGMAGTGPQGGGRDLTGVAVPPDLPLGGGAQDVLTQVDGTYGAGGSA